MNIPYYFQYDAIACFDSMDDCNCSRKNSTEEEFHPNPWWGSHAFEIANTSPNKKSQNSTDYSSEIVVFWMHCLSDFQETRLWNLWFILYEVSNATVYSQKNKFLQHN